MLAVVDLTPWLLAGLTLAFLIAMAGFRAFWRVTDTSPLRLEEPDSPSLWQLIKQRQARRRERRRQREDAASAPRVRAAPRPSNDAPPPELPAPPSRRKLIARLAQVLDATPNHALAEDRCRGRLGPHPARARLRGAEAGGWPLELRLDLGLAKAPPQELLDAPLPDWSELRPRAQVQGAELILDLRVPHLLSWSRVRALLADVEAYATQVRAGAPLASALAGELRFAPKEGGEQVDCPYCRDRLEGELARCEGCATALHAACADELGRCTTLGCAAGRFTRERA
ncbi:MAG TPA: hypothetical protein DEA08_31760 [Planctomycetes bacterium]|nr:hypothetical protein [Planctomycetota bacterium]